MTGNMGYVGPVVTAHLRRVFPDAELWGFDTGLFAACLTGTTVLPEYVLDRQCFGDVRRLPPSVLEGVDAIVHLAAVSNDPIGNRYERVTDAVNHVATRNLAGAARAAGVRSFVFASSCSMYGAAASSARSEESPLDPLTAYARSKVLAERDLCELATDGFTVTALRFATACGMSPRLRLDLVLNDFVACAVSRQPITVLSDGTPWRPLVDVQDMARAIEWALGRQAATDRPFLAVNVGRSACNYQVRDLAHAVAGAVPGTVVSINAAAPSDPRSYRVDFGLFERLAPDHQPRVALDGSIRNLIAGLGAMGFCDREFRRSGLMRLNHLDRLRGDGLLDDALRWTARAGTA